MPDKPRHETHHHRSEHEEPSGDQGTGLAPTTGGPAPITVFTGSHGIDGPEAPDDGDDDGLSAAGRRD